MPQALIVLVVSVIVTMAIKAAISVVLGALGVGGKRGKKPSDGQQTRRQAVSSRERGYGYYHTGGVLTFYESGDGDLYSIFTVAHGEVDDILEHRINNKVVTVTGGIVDGSNFAGNVELHEKLGTASQTAITAFTSGISTYWTSNHRQRGCAHVGMICRAVSSETFAEVYEGGREPTYSAVVKAAKLYDPRLDSTNGGSGAHRLATPSTWAWSDNAALVIADYLMSADGYGMGSGAINWANIIDEADVCDETVTDVNSDSVDRYRIWGSYLLAEDERKAVLGEMLQACDGFVWQDGDGLVNLKVGRWEAPTVEITDDHIISCSASLGPEGTDRCNEVRVVYTDAAFDYTETEADPIIDAAEQTRVGQKEIQRFDIYYCPHHNQAKRLGKRLLAKLQAEWRLTLVVNLFGLNLLGERFCTVSIDELDIAAETFEVVSLRILPEAGAVELGLVSVAETDFDFDSDTEEGTPPGDIGGSGTYGGGTVPPVTGLTLTTTNRTIEGAGGVVVAAYWTTAGPGVTYIAQYQETGGGAWTGMTVDNDYCIASGLGFALSGIEYTVRVASISQAGRYSAWVDDTILIPAGEAPAEAGSSDIPDAFVVNQSEPGWGILYVGWIDPAGATLTGVEVYRGTTIGTQSYVTTVAALNPGTATASGYVDTGRTPGTTYYYKLRAVYTGPTYSAYTDILSKACA